MRPIDRRTFLKFTSCGLAAIAAGTLDIPPFFRSRAFAANQTITLSFEPALVEMIDKTQVFHWVFSSPGIGPTLPGPVIFAVSGDQITINLTNNLPEPHAFQVLGTAITTGPILPGQSTSLAFTVPDGGTYLYLDPLNAPVNRVLGLHGALVVLPKSGNTPYTAPTTPVQQLFDDLGSAPHFPGESWLSDPSANRFRIWLFSSIDPNFNARVQRGETLDPADFTARFLPRYFTINGRSGAFSSHDPDITPSGRIGQPHLIRILNAGMAAHSPHMHANHFYLLSVNNSIEDNVFNIDTYHVMPQDRVDILLPFIRPPDIAGDQNIPLRELIPNELRLVLITPQSPLEWPMHCHMEMSQTAAGGNYPQGLVTHLAITGDVDGVDFPVWQTLWRQSPKKEDKKWLSRSFLARK